MIHSMRILLFFSVHTNADHNYGNLNTIKTYFYFIICVSNRAHNPMYHFKNAAIMSEKCIRTDIFFITHFLQASPIAGL